MKKINSSRYNLFAKQYVLLFSFLIAVYAQVMTFDYTGFDDDFLIVNNMPALRNWDNFSKIFTENSFLSAVVYGFYRPLQTLTFMMDAHLSSGSLFVFHLTNLILHIITVFLLYSLLRKFDFDERISLFLCLFYGINPLFVSAVAWLPSRGDLLLTLFGLASFVNFIEFVNKKKLKNLVLNILFFAIALFSKETGAFLPVIFILYFLMKKGFGEIKSLVFPVLLWFIIGLLWFYLRSLILEELPGNQIFGIIPLKENIPSFLEYLGKFFIPIKLDLLPVYGLINTVIGGLVLVILMTLIIRLKLEWKYLIFGLLWYFLLVFPGALYSRNYPFNEQFYQYLDHRSYLPMVGIVIFLGFVMSHFKVEKYKRNFTIYSMLLIIVFSLISFFKVQYYKMPEKFLTKAIEQNDKSSVANFLLANYYKDKNDYDRAINYYTKAIKINPSYSEAFNNRGILYALFDELDLALNDMNKAIELNPQIEDGYYNRAMILEALGEIDEAIKDYTSALREKPNDKVIMLSLSNLYQEKEDYLKSQSILEKIIDIDPNYYAAYYNLGNLHLDLGNYGQAVKYYTKTLNIEPDYVNAYINRAAAYWNMKEYDFACKDWFAASQLGDKNSEIMYKKYCIKGGR